MNASARHSPPTPIGLQCRSKHSLEGVRVGDVPRPIKVVLLAGFVLGLAVAPINSTKDVLAASPSPPAPPSRNLLLPPPRLVNLQGLPASLTTTQPNVALPFLPWDRASFAAAKQLANQGRTGRRSGVVQVPTAQPQVARSSAPQTQQQLAGFPVMDLTRQVTLYGSGQSVSPPDTQLAAGTTYLVEADNSALSIWTKSGLLVESADLNVFFLEPSGYHFSDPRILYDTESGRWFLSGLGITATNDSQVYIAVSTTSDPTGSWNVYLVASMTGVLGDQPMTGVNTDKVVISWNDYTGSLPATAPFTGQETWVLQKSDLVSGVGLHASGFAPDMTRVRIVPAQSLTATTTEWLSYNNSDCAAICNTGTPTVGVVAINGTPLMGNVTWTETDPALGATTVPPDPRQPSGVPVVQDNDDRFISAVWQAGLLWVSGTEGCVPSGDSTTRSCMKLVAISTGGVSPIVAQDINAGQPGFDLYYPAVTLNSSGDLFIGYSESSSTMFPSALAVDSLAPSPTTFENPVTLASGLNSYLAAPTNRWGDYSAAAPDPTNPADVWVTAEYQASSTNTGNWGTATGRLAIRPSITNVSPNFGSPAGGTSVTVTGGHFQSGAAVSFGSSAATNVIVVSGQEITATTPAAAGPGPVNVVVTNLDGSAGTAASIYTYASTPTVTSVVPSVGLPSGGTAVTINGANFTGVTAVTFGTTAAASFTFVSDGQITAVSPAHVAGPVDITVVAPAGANATTQADQFTYEVTPPSIASISALSPNSGPTPGVTLVTITGMNFTGATAVTFGAIAAASFTFVSDSQITAVSPAHTAGAADVTVTTPAGTSATTPSDQFTYTLSRWYFPWYDLASPGMLADNIHLLNAGGALANITVTLPGANAINVALPAGQETYVSFGQGHIGGPVVVIADQQVLVSQRVQYYQTFNEVWAESAAQAATASYVNWYDKASAGMLNDNIHLLNPGSATATVTVSLPGVPPQMATIAGGAEAYVTFPQGTIGGPVTVSSTQPVLASQRVQYYSSFKEVWAESAAQAVTTSYVNWYDKASPGMFSDNIHILNPGSSIATVTVSLPGASPQIVTVPAGGESYVTFPAGTIGGPALVSSNQPVLASQRVQYYATFNEVWSESAAQAATTSHVTWYDKASPGMFNDNIHLLNPGNSIATVIVSLPGATPQTVAVAAGGESYVTFPPGSIGGPVTVSSDLPVLASQRVQYYSSFNEIWAA
jgi:IPT/TIG domain-containing protein